MSKCTTDAFIEQLKKTFKEVRNKTFDRYQFFSCKQEVNEPLEKFNSRIKQKAALCNWKELEDSLVKIIFIQVMRNAQIQMDLLSEFRDPIGTLQYALERERGQKNQQNMKNSNRNNIGTNPIGTNEAHYVRRSNIQQSTGILPTPKRSPIPDCWKWGYKFVPGNLNTCQAKQEICRIFKKMGHYAKMCKAEMPPRPPQWTKYKNNIQNASLQNTYVYNNNQNNTKRVRNINTTSEDKTSQAGSTHSAENETVDPESTCYIRKMMED